MNKKELKKMIKADIEFYNNDNLKKNIYHRLTRNVKYLYCSAIINSRKYRFYKENNNTLVNKILCIYYGIKQSKYIKKHFIEIGGEVGKNLRIYHSGIIISPKSKLGDNVKLHGFNCIGNNGSIDKAPQIGNNVDIGIGAILIGDIKIANNITIGAGAVVNKDFLEEGITIAGIPAKKIK